MAAFDSPEASATVAEAPPAAAARAASPSRRKDASSDSNVTRAEAEGADHHRITLASDDATGVNLLERTSSALAAQLEQSQRFIRDMQEELASTQASAATSPARASKPVSPRSRSHEAAAHKQLPSTAHIFLPPPPATHVAASPHTSILPSGMQPRAAQSAASHHHSLPASYDPTAYAASCALVYGSWPAATSLAASAALLLPSSSSGSPAFAAPGASPAAAHAAAAASSRANMFKDGLLSDSGPYIRDSFQYKMSLALAEHRASAMAASAKDVLAQQQAQQSPIAAAASPSASPSGWNLQQQLRNLAGSPLERSTAASSHVLSSPVPLASPFASAAASSSRASPRFTLSQLQSSPGGDSGSFASRFGAASQQQQPSSSPFARTQPRGSSSLLHTLSSTLQGFNNELLAAQASAARQRAAMLDTAEHDFLQLQESLALEVRNCASATPSMQRSVENGIRRWESHHSDPWNKQLDALEQALQEALERVDAAEAEQARLSAERRAVWQAQDADVTAAVAALRAEYVAQVEEPSAAATQRLLLTADRLSQRVQTLYSRSHNSMLETGAQLDAAVEQLGRDHRLQQDLLEFSFVADVKAVRTELYEAQQAREGADDDLVQAFQFATQKLQRGLELLSD